MPPAGRRLPAPRPSVGTNGTGCVSPSSHGTFRFSAYANYYAAPLSLTPRGCAARDAPRAFSRLQLSFRDLAYAVRPHGHAARCAAWRTRRLHDVPDRARHRAARGADGARDVDG